MAAAVWWALLLGALALAAGPAGALVFAVLWIVARMTVFYGITVFREISDHVGLQPGSVLGFTRNSPHKPVLSFFRRSVIACWVRGCLRWHRGGKSAAEAEA